MIVALSTGACDRQHNCGEERKSYKLKHNICLYGSYGVLQREPNDESVITFRCSFKWLTMRVRPAQPSAPALAVIVRPGGRHCAKNTCFRQGWKVIFAPC